MLLAIWYLHIINLTNCHQNANCLLMVTITITAFNLKSWWIHLPLPLLMNYSVISNLSPEFFHLSYSGPKGKKAKEKENLIYTHRRIISLKPLCFSPFLTSFSLGWAVLVHSKISINHIFAYCIFEGWINRICEIFSTQPRMKCIHETWIFFFISHFFISK